jgi:hypothetical protein
MEKQVAFTLISDETDELFQDADNVLGLQEIL